MANSTISNEQIAHDLAVALCSKSFTSEVFPASDSDVDIFVHEYFKLYEKVLKSVINQQ